MADYVFTGHSGDSPAVQPTWELTSAETAFNASVAVSIPNATGAGTNFQIPFETESYDIGSNYDAVTGVYTAPTAGLYTFTANIGVTDITAAMTQITTAFIVAGTGPNVGSWTGFRGNPYAMIDLVGLILRVNNTISIILAAGDTVTVRATIFGGAGDTATISGSGAMRTWFSGYRINKIGT